MTSYPEIRFGTDGWRGIVGETFTTDRLVAAVRAFARTPNMAPARTAGRPVIVAHDTRLAARPFALLVAQTLRDVGVHAMVSDGPAATPGICAAILHHGAAAGLMITASHNPGLYLGLKVKGPFGGSVGAEWTDPIVAELDREPRADPMAPPVLPMSLPDGIELTDVHAIHLARIAAHYTPVHGSDTIVHDAMYGSGAGLVERALAGTGVTVVGIRQEFNPGFDGTGPEPIPERLGPMFAAVRQAQAAFGIATDGDADRIAACDETGAYIYPHELIALLTEHLAECGERGAVVCNLATGDIVASVAAYHGLLYISTPVGFKHIVAQMLAREVLIGGEESGGISVARYLKERDAVVCAILLREHLRRRGVSMSRALAELYRRHGYSVYRRFDEHLDVTTMTRLTDRLRTAPPDRIGDARVAALDFTDGVKFRFGPRRWLLVRPSGTEPLVRIYAEDESEVAALARIAAFRNWMSRP